MAAAFFNTLAPAGMTAISAGTQPTEEINPVVVEAMREIGIDISAQRPQPSTPEMVAAGDRVITMGCGVQETCPLYLGMKIDEDWGLDDPAGLTIDAVRPIRDAVKARVVELIARLSTKE